MKWKHITFLFLVTELAIGRAADGQAAGFYLFEQGSKAGGRAFAGSAAATDDVSVLFHNPAGMTELGGSQAAIGAYAIAPNAQISDRDSRLTIGPMPEMSVNGATTGQSFNAQPIGNLYTAVPMTSDLWLGLAVTVPFGIKGQYDPDFFGRYDSLSSDLVVAEFAPTLAYRITDTISLGASIGIQYADAKLTNALPNPLAPGGPSPATDGRFTVKGTDWTPGFTLGAHIRATDRLDIGLSFRSAVTHDLDGRAITEFAGSTTSQGAQAYLDLPEVISGGIAYRLSSSVTLLGQINYFGWSRFEEIRVELADGTETATQEQFKDSWTTSVGVEVKMSPRWNLRSGMQYDETPTQDAFRSTRIPDVDRVWTTIGLSYRLTQSTVLDFSYAHMFTETAPINRVNKFPSLDTTVRTRGLTETSSNVFGMSLRARL